MKTETFTQPSGRVVWITGNYVQALSQAGYQVHALSPGRYRLKLPEDETGEGHELKVGEGQEPSQVTSSKFQVLWTWSGLPDGSSRDVGDDLKVHFRGNAEAILKAVLEQAEQQPGVVTDLHAGTLTVVSDQLYQVRVTDLEGGAVHLQALILKRTVLPPGQLP